MSFSNHRNVPTDIAPFWPRLAVKAVVALAICLTLRTLLAQAPAGPASGGFAAEVQTDARGKKFLVPHPRFTGKDGKKEADKWQKITRDVREGRASLADYRNQFNAYYSLYVFPLMTHTTEERLKKLADERILFERDLLKCKPDAHGVLIGLTLNEMTNLVRDPEFHPAVRYNAMLIISNLNDVEPAASFSSPQVPVPMLRALAIIFEEFKRPDNPDAIKVAALLGLSRHLEWENEKPPAAPAMPNRTEIIKELRTLAEANEPPLGRNADGHVWMRRRAIEALGFASLKKPDPEVANLLSALLKDETQPLSLRCTVAATMGRIVYQPGTIDPVTIAKELGYLALVAADTQLSRAIKLQKDEEEHAIRLAGQFPADVAGTGVPQGPRAGLMTGGSYSPGGYGEGGMMPGGGGYAAPTMPGAYGTAGLGSSDGGYGGPAGGAYGGEYGPSLDPSMQDPKGYRLEYVRRRLRYDLYCVQLGLTGGEDRQEKTKSKADPTRGMWAAASAQEKEAVDKIYYAVRKLIVHVEKAPEILPVTTAVMNPLGPPPTALDKLEKDMRKELKNVETSVGRKLPAAGTTTTTPVSTPAADLPGAPPGLARPPGTAAKAPGKAN